MIHRISNPLKTNSFFLFGARQTGKTTLVNHLLNDFKTLVIDLLDEPTFRKFSKDLSLFEEQSKNNDYEWILIDEVQRMPNILNMAHKLIESTNLKFALTGSSARKLKRGGANLLAGRAFLYYLHPLTHLELNDFKLEEILNYGSLPKIFTFEDGASKRKFLDSYVGIYLKEEIREEQLVRKIEPFISFLDVIARANGEILNASKLGRSSFNNVVTVLRYIQILTDTLLGFLLPAYHKSVRKQVITSAKFYFFDIGVNRALENNFPILKPGTYDYGKAFEHFFILECYRLNDYFDKKYKLSYLKTKDGVEIDLIIERGKRDILAIEIKSSDLADILDLKSRLNLAKDIGCKVLHVASRDPVKRVSKDIVVTPWKDLLAEIFTTDNY